MRYALPVLALSLAAACGGGGGGTVIPPPTVHDTIRTVQGRVSYFTTGPVLNLDGAGRLLPQTGFVEPSQPRGVQRIPVDILKADGTLLVSTLTGDTGDYSAQVNFGPVPATQVRLRVRTQVQLPFGTIVRVLANPAAQPYIHTSPPSGDPAATTMRVDFNIALADDSAAYAILDALWEAFLTAKSGITSQLPDLDVYWAPGNGEASTFLGQPGQAFFTVAGGLAGNPASNQDAWDGPVLVRLLGEYLLHYFFGETQPRGTVPDDALLVPSVAWREGFLDYFSCLGRGESLFWDTTGIGAQGRVIRFFDIEKFFDPAPPVGPDDPNVYQDPALVGIGSRFTVAEMLWDITDIGEDAVGFPVFLALQKLRNIGNGRLPYLVTYLDRLTADGSLDDVDINVLTLNPEDQGFRYPATVADDTVWPVPFLDGMPLPKGMDPIALDGDLDTTTNPDVGLEALRYFSVNLGSDGLLRATLATAGNLRVELFDANHVLLATHASDLIASIPEAGIFYLRVRSAADPQTAAFTLTVEFD